LAVFHDLFTHHALVRRLFLPDHELSCFFDVAVAAEQAFNPPFFAGLVPVAPKLLAAYRAIHYLLFGKNVQARFLACTDTKMYVGAINGVNR
jgi:hypothetical protein